MDKSDDQRSEAFARRTHLQDDETEIQVEFSDASEAEEHCLVEGKYVKEYRARESVMAASAEIFLVTSACMLIPKRRRFIGCEVNPSKVSQAVL